LIIDLHNFDVVDLKHTSPFIIQLSIFTGGSFEFMDDCVVVIVKSVVIASATLPAVECLKINLKAQNIESIRLHIDPE
jgi:hypothetical protein